MTSPLRTTDFFSLEAGECLNRLEALLSRPEGVSGEEFVRQVRLLRGAALMANLHPVAQAGAAFEALARAVRDGQRAWDAATRELALQVVDDFRALVRRVGDWSEGDTARARRIAADLERVTGTATGASSQGSATAPNQTGVRAFVAREGALIASALDRASRSLRTTTDVPEALHAVLRRMQPLRGLAELSELSPLPEILDGVELVAGDLSRSFVPPPGAEDVLEAAGQALTRVCHDVTELGRPAVDALEARRFTDLLLRTFADERDVVPIESLLAAGETTPPPDPSAAPLLGPVELVSHGEHLTQVADRIASARTGTERDLRLFGLLASLRTLATGGRGQAPEITDWAAAARSRIADGSAASSTNGFADLLREAGALLRRAAADDGFDRSAWQRQLVALDGLAGAAGAGVSKVEVIEVVEVFEVFAVVETVETVATDRFETLLQADAIITAPDVDLELTGETDVIVPIESLAPDPVLAESAIATAERASSDDDEPSPFEASLISYADLVHELGIEDMPLPELAGESTGPERLPDPEPVLAIGDLLYRGTAALRRAAELQIDMRAQLARGQHIAVLRPMLDELLDLVPLALDGA